jgi:hypothetical protein
MGLLTDFFVAPRAKANQILDGSGTKGVRSVQLKGLDPVKLASLETILAKQQKRKSSKPGDLPMLTDEAAEQWMFLVPPSLVELLANVGKDAKTVATAWAKTPELKADHWSESVAARTIAELGALAAEAIAKKSDLLLRMSM